MNRIRLYTPDTIFEVTARTANGAFWFDPVAHPEIAAAFHAIFARAQQKHGVKVYAYFVLSNHYHALYSAPDADSLADFLGAVHAAMARFANRVNGRTGPVFARNSYVKAVVDEPAMVSRLAYIMGQGVKIKGICSVDGWPGAHTNVALTAGEPLQGVHFDQHQKTLDSRRVGGPDADENYVTRPIVALSVLPCWRDLSADQRLERYRAVAAQADQRFRHPDNVDVSTKVAFVHHPNIANEVSSEADNRPTPTAVREQPKPKRAKRPKSISCHAGSKQAHDAYAVAYRAICEQHREAQTRLAEQAARALAGARTVDPVVFPAHTFACAPRLRRLPGNAPNHAQQSRPNMTNTKVAFVQVIDVKDIFVPPAEANATTASDSLVQQV